MISHDTYKTIKRMTKKEMNIYLWGLYRKGYFNGGKDAFGQGVEIGKLPRKMINRETYRFIKNMDIEEMDHAITLYYTRGYDAGFRGVGNTLTVQRDREITLPVENKVKYRVIH